MNLRQSRILELLEKNGRVSIAEIKEMFNVSDMTVRRDLLTLDQMGYVTKVHGGVLAKNKLFLDGSFSHRERKNIKEKKAIANQAAGLIEPGENVILDTGTTTLYLARELVKSGIVITVATTSLAVASTLFNSNIDVLIFGGFLRREIPDLIGPLTEKNLADFHADKLFVGCDGVLLEEGFFTSDLNISHLEEKMVNIADEVIVIADSSKFGRKSFVKYADITMVDKIITDSGVGKSIVEKFGNKGIEVVIADI